MGFIYENMVRPVLFKMEPEQAHDRGRTALMTMGALPTLCRLVRHYNLVKEDKPVKLFGLEFPNRVGLAAGMDKDGEFPRAIEALGFGHAEVGTVTPEGQPGNPRTRLFRYPEQKALINRMGFNNKGADVMLNALAKNYPKGKRGMPVGVNIGKAKTTPLDHASMTTSLASANWPIRLTILLLISAVRIRKAYATCKAPLISATCCKPYETKTLPTPRSWAGIHTRSS